MKYFAIITIAAFFSCNQALAGTIELKPGQDVILNTVNANASALKALRQEFDAYKERAVRERAELNSLIGALKKAVARRPARVLALPLSLVRSFAGKIPNAMAPRDPGFIAWQGFNRSLKSYCVMFGYSRANPWTSASGVISKGGNCHTIAGVDWCFLQGQQGEVLSNVTIGQVLCQ